MTRSVSIKKENVPIIDSEMVLEEVLQEITKTKNYFVLVKDKKDKIIGRITSGIFSPRIKKNIGLSMISKDYWKENQKVLVENLDGKLVKGTITSLPFPK